MISVVGIILFDRKILYTEFVNLIINTVVTADISTFEHSKLVFESLIIIDRLTLLKTNVLKLILLVNRQKFLDLHQ